MLAGMASGSVPPLRRARSRLPAASMQMPNTKLCCKISTNMPGSSAEASPVDVLPIGTDVLSTVGTMPLPADSPCMAANCSTSACMSALMLAVTSVCAINTLL